MRVFISSVRRGLEQERDALPGLLKAIGFEPVRFEDFTAQPTPSRQACLDGVDSADAYLLLLGPHYGHVFEETGQSATHDEYVRALARGLPRLVFVKDGTEMDDEQKAFVEQVGDYGSGSFWASFSDVTDLQPKVAAALRAMHAEPDHLTFETLTTPPAVTWKDDWEDPRAGSYRSGHVAEMHAVPIDAAPVPGRVLRNMPERLIGALRVTSVVPAHAGLEPRADDQGALVAVPVPARNQNRDAVQPSHVRGVRVGADGQISVWWDLPQDGLGGILSPAEFGEAAARALRLAGAAGVTERARYAVAVGVSGSLLSVVEGAMPQGSRRNAAMASLGSNDAIRVLPDESVSAAAFDRGATEYGRELASAVLGAFQQRR